MQYIKSSKHSFDILGFSNMTSQADEFSEDNEIYQFLNKEKLDFNINLSKSQDMIHFPPLNLSDDGDNSDDDAHSSAKLGSLKVVV